MAMPLRLEVFQVIEEPEVPALVTEEELEEIRLAAYETGYNAGWEDSGQQAERQEAERRAAVERQLEALNFTYHEARGHVLRALEPVLEAMLQTLVPEAARASVVPMVIEQLLPLAGPASETPVTLRISPGSRDDFVAAFTGMPLPPIKLVESPDMATGQAEFSFDTQQTRVDLSHVVDELHAAIRRFYQIQFEESRYG